MKRPVPGSALAGLPSAGCEPRLIDIERARPPTGRRILAAWPLLLGLALLALLWLGPLPQMSRRAFSPHMILHLGVAVVAAPLIAAGLLRFRRLAFGSPMGLAVAASGLELLVVWGWHAPLMHAAAALHDGAFIAQQASFLAAGIGIWLVSFSGSDRASFGVGAMAMLFTVMHMAMLGALLSLAPDLLYPPQFCLGAFGLDPLQDQRLGGALMAVGGGLPFLLGGLVLAYRLLAERPPASFAGR